MPGPEPTFASKHLWVERHPVPLYFLMTFAISWLGAFLVVAPKLVGGQAVPRFTGVLMFPVMLLGPSVAGIALTRVIDGPSGMAALFRHMRRFSLPLRWYAVVLIPPCLILVVLMSMKSAVSPVFAPSSFFKGIAFALPAALFEEIGWMGYAFPKMWRKTSAFAAAIELGLLWSLWHLPVIDFLGTAAPHGKFLSAYFLAFSLAMIAMRVLISWSYVNTESVWLAQLIHISSTGSLVLLSPARVNSSQEALWYGVYGLVLWVAVAIVVKLFGTGLGRDTFVGLRAY